VRKDNSSAKINYINNLYAPENELQREIVSEINSCHKSINIAAYEGKILQILITLGSIKKIVEIGTHYGYSSLWMAEALPKDGRLITIEKDEARAEKARLFFEKSAFRNKIELLQGKASEILPSLEEEGPFDMVFIDADKKSYPNYLEWAYENLRVGGLVVADNTLLFGSVYDEEEKIRQDLLDRVKKFNQMLADSSKFLSVIIPTEEGLTISVKL